MADAIRGRGLAVVSWLGGGAHGDVYDVRDEATGERLALKVLRDPQKGWLVGFKREFRFLSDVRHPNLVGYHGLWTDGDRWFLLMERIDGIELSSLLRVAATPPGSNTTLDLPTGVAPPHTLDTLTAAAPTGVPAPSPETAAEREAATLPVPAPLPPAAAATLLPLPRVRAIARGLAEGLRALHRTGHLHRDLKPGNVILRASDDQPVLLDFGLITHQSDGAATVMGTPRYMAPECLRPPVGPAADWYAFGLILYELLTGRVPIEGSGMSLVRLRASLPPPPPTEFVAGVPGDLAALVVGLLHPDPAARPDGDEVARRLQLGAAPAEAPPLAGQAPFVGRHHERAVLAAAAAAAAAGCQAVLCVQGPTGLGKSALLDRFVDGLGEELLVLRSRCHLLESVPHKALDGVVDALSLALRPRGRQRASGLDIALDDAAVDRLEAAFPVLRHRLGRTGQRRANTELDEALTRLLLQVAAHRTPVIVIDDAQWGDADSAALLTYLLRHGPPMVLVLAHRDEAPGAFLAGLAPVLAQAPRLALSPLGLDEARALADGLGAGALDTAALRQLLHQSHGHPYLLSELLRDGGHATGDLSDLIAARMGALGPGAARLVDLVGLSPGAVPERVLRRAAGADGARFRELTGLCRAARLLRAAAGTLEQRLLPWHDRVAEVSRARVEPAERRALHQALAAAWEHEDPDAHEVLAVHHEGAGQWPAALAALREARARAEAARAHAHAVTLGRRILALPGAEEADRRALVDALVRSGQRRAAARELELLAAGAAPLQAARDRRHAAEHLLRSGHVDEGLALFEALAADAGIPLGGPRWRLLLWVVWLRLRVWWRGYTPAAPTAVAPARRERAELAGAINRGMRFVATLDGVAPSAICLLEALDIGDPDRLLSPMVNELNTLCVAGSQRGPGAAALESQLLALFERVEDPVARANFWLELAGTSCLKGDFTEAMERLNRGEALFAEQGEEGAAWIDTRYAYLSMAAWFAGSWQALADQTARGLREADRRDDRWTATWLRLGWSPVAQVLLGHSLSEARAGAERGVAVAGSRAPVLRNAAVVALAQIDLLAGRPADCLARLDREQPRMKAAFLLEAQFMRVAVHETRARAGLMLQRQGDPTGAAQVAASLAALAAEKAPWADGLAAAGRACGAALSGAAPATCAAAVQDAADRCAAAGLHGHAAMLRRVLGTAPPLPEAFDAAACHDFLFPGLPPALPPPPAAAAPRAAAPPGSRP